MLIVNEDIKSDTYISRPGADEADRAYFATAPTWVDKDSHVLRTGSKFETVGGEMHVQRYLRVATGLPVTLEGDEKDGAMFNGEFTKLKAMFDEGTELELSEDDGVTTIAVSPDPSKDSLGGMKYTDKYHKRMRAGTIHLIRA